MKIKYHKKLKVKGITYYFLYKIKKDGKDKYKIYVAMNSSEKMDGKVDFKNLPKKVQKLYGKMNKLISKQFKSKKKVSGIPKDVYKWIKALKKLHKIRKNQFSP